MQRFIALVSLFLALVLTQGCKKSNETQTQTGSSKSAVTDPNKLIATGKNLTSTKGCIACHSFDGSKRIGPTFKGLYGSERTVITNGKERKVTANDDYLKLSIQKPTADLVKGFEKVLMVTVPVSDDEATALIAFIKSLK